jgi:uncharacterized membrane protein YbhN (UPF0104 family)
VTSVDERPPGRRPWLTWIASLVLGGGFLWLASRRLRLWPDALDIPHPELVAAALAVHLPYAWTRAMRLRYLLDPVVARATAGRRSGISRSILQGSGWVSFFVLLVLPLKLGELSRPLLLSRAREPGVGLTESVSAVATERVVDGLMICGMLFGGLALTTELAGESASTLADVRRVGQGMLALFVFGLAVLWIAGRDPQAAGRLAMRVAGRRVAAIVERFASAIAGLRDARRALPLLGWSAVYWAITTFQLWLVLAACGVQLGPAAVAATVAIVGLSIQLPGGPAQAGTFQVGAALALGLFLDDAAQAAAGSSFAVVMYVLQFVAAAAIALPGLLLLRRGPSAGQVEPPREPA